MVTNMEKYRLHTGWEFCLDERIEKDEKAAPKEGFRPVTLPHDWSTDYPFDPESPTCGSGGYAKAGIGWYQRTITVSGDNLQSQQIILYFEGIYMKSSVFVNGTYVGGHIYGYTPFELDITALVHSGENTILVRVDNAMQPGSRWYSGSGITRDVWLETRYPIHIARYGMYLTTDVAKLCNLAVLDSNSTSSNDSTDLDKEATLHISMTLHAPKATAKEASTGKLTAEFMLLDAFRQTIATKKIALDSDWTAADGDAAILSGIDEKVSVDICQVQAKVDMPVVGPTLWDHEHPNLYELVTVLKENDDVIDERTDKVGFREITFDAKKGFLINGRREKLNGVCLHHDGGCVGAAVPPEIWRRRLEKLKDMGVNSVRCSHNPPDTALLDLCDELGFYVMDEAFDEWRLMKAKEIGSNTHESHGYSMYFDECHEWDIKTMLYRDRNHPGIVLWSIGNEIPEEVVEGGEALAIELRDYCHTIDPTRKITLAHDQIAAEPYSARQEFMDQIDVVGYNYVGRWRERAELLYDADREEHLDRCVIGTENPSAGYIRSEYNFEVEPGSFWNKPYYTAAVTVGKLLRYTMVHDFVAGDYMWTGIDYLGEANWPQRSAGCGCLDTCGFEKDAFYFYRSVWNQKEKFAYLCPHWNLKLEKGTVVPVICYTNCEDAELFVNGHSFGMKSKGFPCYGMTERYGHFDRWLRPANTDDLFLSWDVPFEPGKIEVVGYHDGKEVCRYAVETTGTATQIVLTTDKTTVDADGRSVVQAEIRVVDEKGRLVPDACPELTFILEGDGEIIGIDNGNPACHEQWKEMQSRHAFNGMAYVVIRAGQTADKLTLTVGGIGTDAALGNASVTIEQR